MPTRDDRHSSVLFILSVKSQRRPNFPVPTEVYFPKRSCDSRNRDYNNLKKGMDKQKGSSDNILRIN